MRTTLDLDDDVLLAARERARREGKSMGEVVSELARAALTAPVGDAKQGRARTVHGFRPFPTRGGLVTNELIDKLREDDSY